MGEQVELKLEAPESGRRAGDFYPTPEDVVEAGCEVMSSHLLAQHAGPVRVLDPCCGEGSILFVARRWAWDKARVEVEGLGIEVDRDHALNARIRLMRGAPIGKVWIADALSAQWPAADLVMMNPPYRNAMPFVEKALEHVERHGSVAAILLRLAWLAGQKRRELHRRWPADVYVLSKRPCFTGDGRSDNSEYAWLVYRKGREGGRWMAI